MKVVSLPKPQCVVAKNLRLKPKFPVFDIHTHMGKLLLGDDYSKTYDTGKHIEKLKDHGVFGVVNLDGVWGSELDEMLSKTKGFEEEIITFCWIDVSRIDEADFYNTTKKHILDAYDKGIRGIKMWKVISLNQKDAAGNYIRTDDERLDVVYETARHLGMVILIHIADPVAFFEEVDSSNERYDELKQNPDWSFLEEDQMSFKELMDMQDNMIRSHPETKFIVAHFGSFAENLDHVASRLDMFPNMYIDIAARVAELGRVPYSAREFFIKYQDRILFGTDETPLSYNQYSIIYRFLETSDEYFPYWADGELPGQGNWYIYGLGLPDDVLEKVYSKNAIKLLNIK